MKGIGAAVRGWPFVLAVSGSHVNLAAQYGFDFRLFGMAEELHGPEQVAVIRHGHGLHAKVPGLAEKVLDANGPVQETVFRMDMKVDKG